MVQFLSFMVAVLATREVDEVVQRSVIGTCRIKWELMNAVFVLPSLLK